MPILLLNVIVSCNTETPGAQVLRGREDAVPDRRQVARHVGHVRPPVDLAVPLEVLLLVLDDTRGILGGRLDVVPLQYSPGIK